MLLVKRIFIGLLVILIGVCLTIFIWAPRFLTYNHPVPSSHLLLEGWLPPYEIEQAVSHYYQAGKTKFLISGKNYQTTDQDIIAEAENYFEKSRKAAETYAKGIILLTNSTLFIRINKNDFPKNAGAGVKFKICLNGTVAEDHASHYQLYIDGKRMVQAFATGGEDIVTLACPDTINPPVYIAVQFDNDLKTETEDRNLRISSLTINSNEIPLNLSNVYVVKHAQLSVFGFSSESKFVKNYLLELGVEPGDISTLEYNVAIANQTLASAQHSAAWAEQQHLESINIISSGIHSRRSWISYKRTFSDDIQVGIICFPPASSNQKHGFRSLTAIGTLFDEVLSYFLNWMQLSI